LAPHYKAIIVALLAELAVLRGTFVDELHDLAVERIADEFIDGLVAELAEPILIERDAEHDGSGGRTLLDIPLPIATGSTLGLNHNGGIIAPYAIVVKAVWAGAHEDTVAPLASFIIDECDALHVRMVLRHCWRPPKSWVLHPWLLARRDRDLGCQEVKVSKSLGIGNSAADGWGFLHNDHQWGGGRVQRKVYRMDSTATIVDGQRSTPIDFALRYAAMGWPVFPVYQGTACLPGSEVSTRDYQGLPGLSGDTRAIRGYHDIYSGSEKKFSDREIVEDQIEKLIQRTLPTEPGHRHRNLFNLARGLKFMPELADKPIDELRLIVKTWHERALPVIV
ncbi:hypothetical protein LCGC14_3157700, partial [marine sediment metagenome]